MQDRNRAEVMRNSPTDWRAVELSMLTEAEAHERIAAEAYDQAALPPLLATDFAMAVSEGHLLIARAARFAAEQAGLFASDMPVAS